MAVDEYDADRATLLGLAEDDVQRAVRYECEGRAALRALTGRGRQHGFHFSGAPLRVRSELGDHTRYEFVNRRSGYRRRRQYDQGDKTVTLDTNPVRAEVSRAWSDARQGDLRTGHALYRLKMPKEILAWRVTVRSRRTPA